MKSFKRIAAVAMALMLLLSVSSFALAADADGSAVVKVTTVSNSSSYTVENSVANVLLKIETSSETPLFFTVTGIQMETSSGLIAIANKDSVVAQETAGGKIMIPAAASGTNGSTTFLVPITVPAGSTSGTAKIKLALAFYATDEASEPTSTNSEYIVDANAVLENSASYAKSISFTVPAKDGSDTGNGGDTPTAGSAFRISPVDASGARVPAPSGNYGNTVTVRIPLIAKTSVSDVTIAPVITTSLDTFPFVISNVDYTLSYPGAVNAGQIIEFQYTFTLSKNVTAGVKQIDFMINAGGNSWDAAGASYSDKVSIFLTVVKGATAPSGDGTPPVVSTPKLIVDSYTISTDKVYAGETFDVTFVLRNTSDSETIQNLQIHIADSANVVLPANSGSNTLYVAKIGKGETHTETISLQTTPGAEAKAYTLSLDMDYEAASTKTAYKASETITVPVLQKIRVKADNPVIYDEAWIGSPFSMYTAFYNLGKSAVYNCTVSVEGDGLTMEEGYFGGNVTSGSSMNADFTVIPSVGGDISANVVITYEDVYGEQYELKMPFTVYVNDPASMGGEGGIVDGGVIEPIPGEGKPVDGGFNGGMQPGIPVWVWIAIGVAVVAGAVVLIILLKRKRNKELEEV